MSIQREQNKVMLFKSLSLQMVRDNTVPVGRIYHLFEAETHTAWGLRPAAEQQQPRGGCLWLGLCRVTDRPLQ